MYIVKINGNLSMYADHILPSKFSDIAVYVESLPVKPEDKYHYHLDLVDNQVVWVKYEEDISTDIEERVNDSKIKLAEYLEQHPLTWHDGNQYSVTSEKQALLTSQLALYSIAVAAGQPYELKWNTSGGVCSVWTHEALSALALAIGAYVQPLVTYQQSKEVEMTKSTTLKELNAIKVNYDEVYNPVIEMGASEFIDSES